MGINMCYSYLVIIGEYVGGAEQDHKTWFFEMLWGLEKVLAQVYYIRGGLLWRGQNGNWWINKYFLKKIKIHLTFWSHLVFLRIDKGYLWGC